MSTNLIRGSPRAHQSQIQNSVTNISIDGHGAFGAARAGNRALLR